MRRRRRGGGVGDASPGACAPHDRGSGGRGGEAEPDEERAAYQRRRRDARPADARLGARFGGGRQLGRLDARRGVQAEPRRLHASDAGRAVRAAVDVALLAGRQRAGETMGPNVALLTSAHRACGPSRRVVGGGARVELLARVVQPRAHRQDRRADDAGDLFGLPPFDLVQDEDDALLGRQLVEDAIDRVEAALVVEHALGRLGALRLGGALADVVGGDLGATLALAQPLQRDVDAEAVEPGRELGVAAEAADRAEDLDEHLLQHVLEIAATGAEHAMQVARDLGAVQAVELAERFLVAALAAGDQVGLRRWIGDGVQLSGVHPVPWWIVPRKTFSAGSSCSYLLLVRVASRRAERGEANRPRPGPAAEDAR